jgi:hypothetical protein
MIDINQVPSFYQGYVKQLTEGTVTKNLRTSGELIVDLLSPLSEEQGEYAYGPDKWTIKEVILHLIDSERIFAYRALRFARNDKTDLPGFEQNDYVPESNANARTINSLISEFLTVRVASTSLYESLDEETMKRIGTANGFPVSVEAIGFIISGHCVHHANIIKERYLNGH